MTRRQMVNFLRNYKGEQPLDLGGCSLTKTTILVHSWEDDKRTISKTDYSGIALPYGTNFSHGMLSKGIFRGANLPGANFHSTQLFDVDFTGATLPDAVFTTGFYVLMNVKFNNAILTGAKFTSAGLYGKIDFTGAKLDGADFTGVSFAPETYRNPPLQERKVLFPKTYEHLLTQKQQEEITQYGKWV